MESFRPAAGPPLFLVPPGELAAQVMTLTGPEGHHAAAVRRLRTGERAEDVGDGAGTIAEGVVSDVGKNSVTLEIRTVHAVPPPQPLLTVAQALPKGDRGELAVELMTEIGVDAVIPWAAERSITKWHAERGDKALANMARHRPRSRRAVRRASPPEITDLATTAVLAQRVSAATCAIVLEADAIVKLSNLPLPETGEILLLVGPEGGISPAERDALRSAGAVEARLGPTVLRTSTAGAAAAAILLSQVSRWLRLRPMAPGNFYCV